MMMGVLKSMSPAFLLTSGEKNGVSWDVSGVYSDMTKGNG